MTPSRAVSPGSLGSALSPIRAALGLVASGRPHRPAAAKAPRATDSLCTPMSKAFPGYRALQILLSRAQGFPLVEKTCGSHGSKPVGIGPPSPGGASKTRSVRCSVVAQWRPLPLPACLGLKGRAATVSRLVKATRPTAFPSADQLPDWWLGWGPAMERGSQQHRECRMRSCRV